MQAGGFVFELDYMVAGGHYQGAEHVVGADVFRGFTVDIGEPIRLVIDFAKDSQPVVTAVGCIF